MKDNSDLQKPLLYFISSIFKSHKLHFVRMSQYEAGSKRETDLPRGNHEGVVSAQHFTVGTPQIWHQILTLVLGG